MTSSVEFVRKNGILPEETLNFEKENKIWFSRGIIHDALRKNGGDVCSFSEYFKQS